MTQVKVATSFISRTFTGTLQPIKRAKIILCFLQGEGREEEKRKGT